MKLRELFEDASPTDQSDEIQAKLVGVLSQLRARINDTGAKSTLSIKAALSKLREVGVTLTPDQLRDMISKPPLSNIIANVTDKGVIFKGQSQGDSEAIDADKSTATLEKMAKRATK